MATRPIVSDIGIFDATIEKLFEFFYNGNTPTKNKIVITNSTTNAVVYTNTVTTPQLRQTVPANTLVNNTRYCAQFSVFDSNNVESSLSDKVCFMCYSNPSFSFSGLSTTTDNSITCSSVTATVLYSQAQNRQLREYQFALYNSDMKLLYQQDTQYYSTSQNGTLSFTYFGLNDNTTYYILCTGLTVDNINVSTGYAKIVVAYSTPMSYNSFLITCKPNLGFMEWSTNILTIDGHCDGSYSLGNGVVIIGDKPIYYNEGFDISGDFEFWFIAKNMTDKKKVCELLDGESIYIQMFPYEGTKYFKLTVTNGLNQYILYRTNLTVATDQNVFVFVRRIGGLYDFTVTPITS